MNIKLPDKFRADIFLLFSWGSNTFFLLMDIVPHILRNFIFRLKLGKTGKRAMIDYKVYMRFMKNIEIGNNAKVIKKI